MSLYSKTGDWLDARTGHRALLAHMLDEPVPGGARWAYIFGSVLVGCIALQAITGWTLMAYYAPSSITAWASVEHISYAVSGGWFVRGLHHFGAQAMVVVVALHLAQVAIYGAYKAPREINWWFGLGLLGVTLGFSLTGYLLPWDQKGYWATRVSTSIAGTVPLGGKFIQRLLQGGPEYGSLTLTRFYSLHVGLLPVLLVALLGAHLALFRRHGVTPPPKADLHKVDKFFPLQVAKDLAGMLIMFSIVAALAYSEHGAPLDAPADPASDYPARPEWYFLSLFQLLKYFEGSLELVGSLVVPGLAGAYLALLPMWDRSPGTALRPRLKYLAPLAGMGLGVMLLTIISKNADSHDLPFQKARALASTRAEAAIALARNGIPPEGPLVMMRRDPETRGVALFNEHCAGCHQLGELGPPDAKATAPDLTGWGTREWAMSMLEDPDAANRFGNSPYKGEMMSVTTPPKDAEHAKNWKPMPEGDRVLIASFLAGEAAESKDPNHDAVGAKLVAQRCTSCHLFRGETDDEESIGPELSGWGSLAWTKAQISNPGTKTTYRAEAMSADRKGHMPRFDDKMEPDEINLLAAWVRNKARSSSRIIEKKNTR